MKLFLGLSLSFGPFFFAHVLLKILFFLDGYRYYRFNVLENLGASAWCIMEMSVTDTLPEFKKNKIEIVIFVNFYRIWIIGQFHDMCSRNQLYLKKVSKNYTTSKYFSAFSVQFLSIYFG